jgi:hypothetical protein
MPRLPRMIVASLLLAIPFSFGCWISPSGESPNIGGDGHNDQTAPVVKMIYPRDGAMRSGAVTISAEAWDDTGILSVEFLIDGTTPENGIQYDEPYEFSWVPDPSDDDSVHRICAKATDTSHNVSFTDTLTFIVSRSIELATSVVLNEDFSYVQVFPPDNWWNEDISTAPVDPNSSAYINWIGSTCRVHPDFGPPPYGIPFISVSSRQALKPIDFYAYPSESDEGAPGLPAGYPIPDIAFQQPDYIEGGHPGGGDNGDRHCIVVDRDRLLLYETYGTTWSASQQCWQAACGAVFDLTTNERRPEGWTSADAAGLAVFPGLIKYDETHGLDEISHAFRFTARASNGYVWPASHKAGATAGAPPLGMRLRLKASFDISGYNPSIQKILRAMKRYGLILADNGSDMFVQGTMDSRWNSGEMNDAIHTLHAGDFEVIQLGWQRTPTGVMSNHQ